MNVLLRFQREEIKKTSFKFEDLINFKIEGIKKMWTFSSPHPKSTIISFIKKENPTSHQQIKNKKEGRRIIL